MNDMILLKLGEIVLKGLNRKNFEQKLISKRQRVIGLVLILAGVLIINLFSKSISH